ncbi:MAG: hypothetical protein ACXWKG_18235 [Limisphaerales bacterium]
MDLFVSLALLLALAILFLAMQRERIADAVAYRKAVAFFVAAVIVHNAVMEIIGMIPHIAFAVFAAFVRVIGYILLLISFYAVCRSCGAPLNSPGDQPAPPVVR